MKPICLAFSYESVSSDNDIKLFLAGPDNSGNLVYLNELRKRFSYCDIKSVDEIIMNAKEFSTAYRAIILPFSNMLSPSFSHPIAECCEYYKLPIILFSIGIQAPLGSSIDNFKISVDANSLLRSTRFLGMPIGVRGNLSRMILLDNGFESTVIGCPSVSGINSAGLMHKKDFFRRICGNNTLSGNHRQLTSELMDYIFENCDGYVLQDESRIIRDVFNINYSEIPFTEYKNSDFSRGLYNHLFDYGYYNTNRYAWGEIRDFFRKKSFFTLNLNRWREFISQFSLSVGTRFHGNVMAMLSDVPAIFLPCDLRTKELVEFHALPFVSSVRELGFITDALISTMLRDFHDHFERNIDILEAYIGECGLSDYWRPINRSGSV